VTDTTPTAADGGTARLAELCACLSLASDLAVGQAFEAGLRSTLIAVALAAELGLDEAECSDVYYLTLLRMAGCTATPEMSDQVGDLQALGARFDTAGADFGNKREAMPLILRHVTEGESPLGKVRGIARMMTMRPSQMAAGHRAHCEVAEHLADAMGATPQVRASLAYTYERWDGSGTPDGVRGDSIPLPVRIATVAYHAEAQHRVGGPPHAAEVVRKRAGGPLDPSIAAVFADEAEALLAPLDAPSPWGVLLDAEPGPPRMTDAVGVDVAAAVLGDFAEASPWMKGHGRRVAALAGRAAEGAGLRADDVADVRRAGHVHDVGQLAASMYALDRPGPLTDTEWDAVRLHAYHTERIVSRAAALRGAATLAGLHHERCDGSGYHRQAAGNSITFGAGLVGAADVFDAICSDRPHRGARTESDAAAALTSMARDGLLAAEAVEAILAAADQPAPNLPSRAAQAGLTEREAEVLGTVARGLSIKQAARLLDLSPKTVDAHLQKVYPKLGVSTRAAATLRAVELGLLDGHLAVSPSA
jgi:HD-GYP domain-containing protein (c-di-GMP phosphodiesterase class II)